MLRFALPRGRLCWHTEVREGVGGEHSGAGGGQERVGLSRGDGSGRLGLDPTVIQQTPLFLFQANGEM